jgi:acyl carrier protein
MEKTNIREKVKGILISVLELDHLEIKENMTASDVAGWDSLHHMVIITEIEKQFNVKFKLRELNKLENLNALIDLIHEKQLAQ